MIFESASRYRSQVLHWRTAVVTVFVVVAIGAAIGAMDVTLRTALLSVVLPVGFVLTLLSFRAGFLAFTFLLFASFDFTGYDPLLNEPIKIYLADGTIVFFVILLARALTEKKILRELDNPLTRILVANFLFGLAAIVVGLLLGNEFNDVLGDFRRLFFYPLVSFTVALAALSGATNRRTLVVLFAFSLLMIAVVGFFRVATGQTWDPEQFVPADDFRAIGYFTGVIVIMGISVFYSLSMISKNLRKGLYLALVAVLIGVAFFSGYRLLWLLTAAIPLLIPAISTQRLSRVKRVLGAAILIILFVSAVLLTARYFSPDLYTLFTDKVWVLVYDFRFGESARYYAWRAAWGYFLDSPLVGKGIGSQFTYWAQNSIGGLYLRTGTTHNVLLSLLYQTGIFGTGLFVVMQFGILRHLKQHLPRLTPKGLVLMAGFVAGYLAALVVAMFQPALESPGAVVVFYVWIAFMFKSVQSQTVDQSDSLANQIDMNPARRRGNHK